MPATETQNASSETATVFYMSWEPKAESLSSGDTKKKKKKEKKICQSLIAKPNPGSTSYPEEHRFRVH